VITFFTVPKPFRGHVGTIQRNALGSWKRADPDGRALLLGDEEGAASAASALWVEQVSDLAANEHGTLPSYMNADIPLFDDLAGAVDRVAASRRLFLVVGETWDVDVTEPLDLHAASSPEQLRALHASRRGADARDYFAFSSDLYEDMPPFAVGRTAFDNWLVSSARDGWALVVGLTARVPRCDLAAPFRWKERSPLAVDKLRQRPLLA
jgi:hypothetical protein